MLYSLDINTSAYGKKIPKKFLVHICFRGPSPPLTPLKAADKGGYGEQEGGRGPRPGPHKGARMVLLEPPCSPHT